MVKDMYVTLWRRRCYTLRFNGEDFMQLVSGGCLTELNGILALAILHIYGR